MLILVLAVKTKNVFECLLKQAVTHAGERKELCIGETYVHGVLF